MLKSIIIVAALVSPAVADTTHHIELALKTERYTLFVADDSCGEVQIKSPSRERMFRVCLTADSSPELRVELERLTRDQNDEVHTKTTMRMKTGSSLSLDDLKVGLK